jgi:hypothetical protein
MKLTKSRLLDIIQEETLAELDAQRAQDAGEWAGEQIALGKASHPVVQAVLKKILPYVGRTLAKPWRANPVGIAADAVGNVAVPGMTKAGLVPGGSSDKTAVEIFTDPNDPRPKWQRVLDVGMGTEYAGGIDYSSEIGRGPLTPPSVTSYRGGKRTRPEGPGWDVKQDDARTELSSLLDDGDVPPEEEVALAAIKETLTRWQKIIKS